jgi:hypothetical protein
MKTFWMASTSLRAGLERAFHAFMQTVGAEV